MRFQCGGSDDAVNVRAVRRLSHDQLRMRTAQAVSNDSRAWAGGDRGPVPAPGADPVPGAPSPILTISSRLPGAAYDTVCELFESHQLVKTSNIRGTVHSSVPEQFACWMR